LKDKKESNPDMETLSPLRDAVVRILSPLVRVLLRNGVSHGTFADIAREVFVQVAMKEFALQNRKQTVSRISVLTGLTRKAVKELMEKPAGGSRELAETYNRAARVIAGWRRDREFQNDRGLPADLPFRGEQGSFSALVRKYSGDIPPRAVFDELERTRAVSRLADGRVQLLVNAYLPTMDKRMKMHILGTDAGQLIDTIGHNLEADKDRAFFQRKVAYDNLPYEALESFRKSGAAQSQKLLERLDSELAKKDRDGNPAIKGTGRYTAGVGIYYFEEKTDNEP
jgi:hypothetical protein